MKRRLFTVFSALSLLLFVAVVVLWVRSIRVQDGYEWASRREDGVVVTCNVHTERGSIFMHHWTHVFRRGRQEGEALVLAGVQEGPYSHAHDGALAWEPWPSWMRHTGRMPWFDRHMLLVRVPMWPAAMLTAILPAHRLFAWHRHRKGRKRGVCPSCGYDLRATPDRCPECGHVPSLSAITGTSR